MLTKFHLISSARKAIDTSIFFIFVSLEESSKDLHVGTEVVYSVKFLIQTTRFKAIARHLSRIEQDYRAEQFDSGTAASDRHHHLAREE
jgi:hypothetical protein